MGDKYLTCDIKDILVGEELPVNLYIYLDFRFITYRSKGDVVNRAIYDRLELKKVNNLFIHAQDFKEFEQWSKSRKADETPPYSAENSQFPDIKADSKRKLLDI